MKSRNDFEKELLPCPFCGMRVKIGICDDEGNIKDDKYSKDPWRGLKYFINHSVGHGEVCPAKSEDLIVNLMYDNMGELVSLWNRRATNPVPNSLDLVNLSLESDIRNIMSQLGLKSIQCGNTKVRVLENGELDIIVNEEVSNYVIQLGKTDELVRALNDLSTWKEGKKL